MKFRLAHILISIACMTLLMSCESSDKVTNSPNEGVTLEDFTLISFDLASGDPAAFPLPNDVLRNPVTGNLAFPPFGDPAVDALIAQVNTLNGFSTSSFIRIPFVGEVDEDSVTSQTLMLVDAVDLALAQGGAQVNPFKTMSFDITTEGGNTLIKATPDVPLNPGRLHMVIVTQGVQDLEGKPIEPDSAMLALKGTASLLGGPAAGLEPLRQVYNAQLWPVAEQIVGVDRLFIPAAWAFTTATLYDGHLGMHAKAQTENPTPAVAAAAIGADAVDGLFSILGLAAAPHDAIGAVYTGSYSAPNYQAATAGVIVSLDNPVYEDINFLATTPPGPGPFPTIIYQHGITSNKETMLAMANTAALAGFASIGIDLVTHGERAIDYNNDGQLDSSGESFIDLANVLRYRDNIRQSVSDQMVLARMINSGAGDLNGDGAPDLLPNANSYLGVSMGGIVGTSFCATEPTVVGANLNVAGGPLSVIGTDSLTFGPRIREGLAAFGLIEGTPLFDLYIIFAQAILDSADPINYAAHLSTGSLSGGVPTAALFQEMIGDGVVPNSSSRRLARAAGVPQVNGIQEVDGLTQVPAPHFGSGFYQFESPADVFTAHGAILTPAGGNPTAAIQLQSLTFLGSVLLGTPTIIDPYATNKRQPDTWFDVDLKMDLEKMNLFPSR